MATNKKKKEVKVRDLKPSKDAKGGVSRQSAQSARNLSASSSSQTGAGAASSFSTKNLN
jgi:hypothetical protein